MNEFVTWDLLGTFVGCTAVVSLITQFLKGSLNRLFPQIGTKIWTLLISLLVLLAVDASKGQLNIETILLSVINSFVVAVSAMGAYDLGNGLLNSKDK